MVDWWPIRHVLLLLLWWKQLIFGVVGIHLDGRNWGKLLGSQAVSLLLVCHMIAGHQHLFIVCFSCNTFVLITQVSIEMLRDILISLVEHFFSVLHVTEVLSLIKMVAHHSCVISLLELILLLRQEIIPKHFILHIPLIKGRHEHFLFFVLCDSLLLFLCTCFKIIIHFLGDCLFFVFIADVAKPVFLFGLVFHLVITQHLLLPQKLLMIITHLLSMISLLSILLVNLLCVKISKIIFLSFHSEWICFVFFFFLLGVVDGE